MGKSKILIVKTGGTPCQKLNKEGRWVPSRANYLKKVKGLDKIANVNDIDLGTIDSTDMQTNYRQVDPYGVFEPSFANLKDRTDIAKALYSNHGKYDGFVIVHGTDTMAETAAALTYMLQDFGKPIILTGGQKSAWAPGTDSLNNIYYAVMAATKDIGEVAVCFDGKILRGPRTQKVDEESFRAFESPRVNQIGEIVVPGVRLANHRIARKNSNPKIFTDFDTRVFNYDHVSGANISRSLFKLIENEEVSGVIMGGFGAGNIPTPLHYLIAKATSLGKPVAVYTKCTKGFADMGDYDVNTGALKAGAFSAEDMTREALGQKMMYALGLANKDSLEGKTRLAFVEKVIRMPINEDITLKDCRK